MRQPSNSLARGFARLDVWLDRAFSPALNPMAQLGALGYFCYWIVAVSGIYLYIAFDTSITGVYQSMEYLTREQWYLGGVMRSLHRYCSDAMVLFMVLHLVKEWSLGRFTGARVFSWLTGVPLILFLYAAGITGYWLVWDRLAQYVAIKTSEWLDFWPIFGEPIARNFISPDAVDDRFFSLMIFMHIFVPLFLLLMMWIHIQRISKPKVNPPRALAAGLLSMFLILSLIQPATSHAAADLTEVPVDLRLDWFYLGLYPLLDMMPAGFVWALAGLGFVVLSGLPYAVRKPKGDVASVHLDNCNGCEWCFHDCPYAAISMVPRKDGKPFERQAEVNPSLCVGCGICAGACPTGSAFRRGDRLQPGIELEGYRLFDLRDRIDDVTAGLQGDQRLLVFACDHGGVQADHLKEGEALVSVPCLGMVHPSFVDYVLTKGLAEGLVFAACGDGDCFNRSGLTWVRQRFARERDPMLRARIDNSKLHLAALGMAAGQAEVRKTLDDFREGLKEETP